MKPIIIIGAPRSGTKMLRGILASHPGLVTFPSEIDYIWKHGNESIPHDELTQHDALPEVKEYIRSQFALLSTRHKNARVVEKSVANSLRVEFVHSVFPDACFVHLVRDGRASVESVRRSWESGFSAKYYLQKFQGVDWSDALYFSSKYFSHHLRRKGIIGSDKGVNGPHFSGMKKLIENKDALEVCAIQWMNCVKIAKSQLKAVPVEQVLEIKYEDLVKDPLELMQSAFHFLDLEFTSESNNYISKNIHDSNLGKWKENLSVEELNLLLPHINEQLHQFGYSV